MDTRLNLASVDLKIKTYLYCILDRQPLTASRKDIENEHGLKCIEVSSWDTSTHSATLSFVTSPFGLRNRPIGLIS